MKRLLFVLAALFACNAMVLAQEPRAYTEGAVSAVTSVKVMDGEYDNYMTFLSKSYKPNMEAQKEAGIILGYAVYDTSARSPSDPDLYLVVTYPNMASMDGLADRTEPVSSKVLGMNRAQANEASAARGKMREILGTELIREMKLK